LAYDHFTTAPDHCPICIEHTAGPTTEISCKHVFHTACLSAWLRELSSNSQAGTCPLCRNILFSS
ncbi:hypothetical protein BDW02DRAFT_479260, partial [Decorospora gaudefroyi]